MSRPPLVTSDGVRNFVFGVEDSLVSTIGLISGIAAAGATVPTIIITGFVLILVEAFSMAAGSLVSDNSADEFRHQSSQSLAYSVSGAIIMFISYVISGLIIILPYIFLSAGQAFYISIIVSLVALFFLGIVSARVSHIPPWRKAATMVLIGGAVILIGVGMGSTVAHFV